MDLPKVTRGGFFGIFIPGAFLLLNMSMVFPISSVFLKNNESRTVIDSIELGFMSFILAFTLGIVIRVISPNYTEIFRKHKFPYFGWFFLERSEYRIRKFIQFYKKFVLSEYPDAIQKEDDWAKYISERKRQEEIGKPWVNYFKTYVYCKSDSLKDEILYQEGLTRFVCGMCYALLLSIILLSLGWLGVENKWSILNRQEPKIPLFLLWSYFILLPIFWYNVPKIRGREVCTTLEAFALLYEEEEKKQEKKNEKMINADSNR